MYAHNIDKVSSEKSTEEIPARAKGQKRASYFTSVGTLEQGLES